jgi:hypothetical protein
MGGAVPAPVPGGRLPITKRSGADGILLTKRPRPPFDRPTARNPFFSIARLPLRYERSSLLIH